MTKEEFKALYPGAIVSARTIEGDYLYSLFIKIRSQSDRTKTNWHFLTGNTFALFEGDSIFENPVFAETVQVEYALMDILQWRNTQLAYNSGRLYSKYND